jgi:tetratricopeptide (TPR) repeat protein
VARRAHAGYFAAAASAAYREFDSQLPEGWLERLSLDLDNFRAALDWTLDGGDRHMGAQLAADSGPLFLRMELLAEGLHWCERARSVTSLSPATQGRIEYVASMLHNNARAYPSALECAERAVSYYRESADRRGLVRALSQLAYQYALSQRFDEARAPAGEAIELARALNEPRVLIAVLRRCAYSMPVTEIEEARALFQEALDTARRLSDVDEACKLLQWWAGSEAAADSFDRAIQLGIEGLLCAEVDAQMYIESDVTGYAIASGVWDVAEMHAGRALQLAVAAKHSVLAALAIAYCAPLQINADARIAATLFGYATARLRELGFDADHAESVALHNARTRISRALNDEAMDPLLERGADLTQQDVLDQLESASRSGHGPPSDARDRVATLLG